MTTKIPLRLMRVATLALAGTLLLGALSAHGV